MKNKIILKIVLATLFICLTIFLVFILSKSIKTEEKKNVEGIKENTCIYDKKGNEIASITYGDTAFFDNVKSYYLALVLDDVINDIKEKENVSEDEAENILVTRGYKIYTCEDINIQNKLEEVYNSYDKFLNNAESATVILDNNTGTIVAIVGGRNKDNRVITFGEPNYNDNVVTNKNMATERLSQPEECYQYFLYTHVV